MDTFKNKHGYPVATSGPFKTNFEFVGYHSLNDCIALFNAERWRDSWGSTLSPLHTYLWESDENTYRFSLWRSSLAGPTPIVAGSLERLDTESTLVSGTAVNDPGGTLLTCCIVAGTCALILVFYKVSDPRVLILAAALAGLLNVLWSLYNRRVLIRDVEQIVNSTALEHFAKKKKRGVRAAA